MSSRCSLGIRLALPLISAALAAGAFGRAAEAADGGQRTVYVRVTDSEGRPMVGLTAEEFRVSVNGEPAEVLESRFFNRAEAGLQDPASGLRLVLYASERLDVREAFRSQRAALHLAGRLDLAKDSAAVYSRFALSGFTSDREKLRWMIRLFGEEIDRMGFGRAATAAAEWQSNWPPDFPDAAQSEATLERLRNKGNQGRLTSVLTPLAKLKGRKILLYFGRDIPYQSEELEYHDPRFAARALSDAGFTVFAFNPSGRDDTGMGRLRRWAEATGGAARSESGDLRAVLVDWLRDMNSFYALSLRDSRPLDCRWSEIEIKVARDGLQLSHPAGFFSTLEAPVDLTQRTLWTVATHARWFHDFPVEMKGELVFSAPEQGRAPQPSALKLALRFPFSATRDEDTQLFPSRSGKFQQRIIIFVGVYDVAGRLLGLLETPAMVSRSREELEEAPEELARLDETIPLERGEPPGRVQAILVIGQNRRIAVEGGVFGAGN